MNDDQIEKWDDMYEQLQNQEWLIRRKLARTELTDEQYHLHVMELGNIHNQMAVIEYEQNLYEQFLSGYQNWWSCFKFTPKAQATPMVVGVRAWYDSNETKKFQQTGGFSPWKHLT